MNPLTSPTFAELGLAEPLCRALAEDGYTSPTPIQSQAIGPLLAGRDLLGIAETGTGKTAAFALPLLAHLSASTERARAGAPRALILAPTRELAIQIGTSLSAYGRHVRVSHAVIFGGVGQGPQVQALRRGVDILVATPGRLIDLIQQRHIQLDQVRHLVLDEADRMLDLGFVRDVRRIVKMVPKTRQSLLFSATMPSDIAALAAEILHNPVRVEVARAGKTVDRIDQRVQFVDAGAKRALLGELLADPALQRVIVFTRTKRGADRVSRFLAMIAVPAHAIHGNKSQSARQKALESFRSGRTRVLVATDIAARGLDIDDVSHVINFELPNVPESYVHRIGRTARAGAEGIAIAFCAPDERAYLTDIERLIRRKLTVIQGQAPSADAIARAEGGDRQRHRSSPHRGAQSQPRQDSGRGHRQGRGGERPHHGKPDHRGEARGHGRPDTRHDARHESTPRKDRAEVNGASNGEGRHEAPWRNWTRGPGEARQQQGRGHGPNPGGGHGKPRRRRPHRGQGGGRGQRVA
ncbi:MAG: DEAD/DEAH box helicase [Hyphomicrobiaceae bacterium]